jgi:hypothetical protein
LISQQRFDIIRYKGDAKHQRKNRKGRENLTAELGTAAAEMVKGVKL